MWQVPVSKHWLQNNNIDCIHNTALEEDMTFLIDAKK